MKTVYRLCVAQIKIIFLRDRKQESLASFLAVIIICIMYIKGKAEAKQNVW